MLLNFDVGQAPPSEFRLFVPGWNQSEKGSFLFDETAAQSVMTSYQECGVDLPMDLEHQMLKPGTSADPTARDARGWFKLELRNGELWAVDVRWTSDGAARVTEKRQRYVSPAFEIDLDSNRITKVFNVALVSMPATHQTPALIAASLGVAMTVEEFLKVLKALDIDPSSSLDDAIAKIKGEDPDAKTEDAPPPAGDGGADETTEAAATPPPPAATDAPTEEEKKQTAILSARLMSLTGKTTIELAIADVEAFRASHIELETGRQKLAAERAVLEAAERRTLCAELVKCGAEFPSTVWADDKATTLKARWLSMSIADLRSHTTEQKAARGNKPARLTPAPHSEKGGKVVETSHGPVALSAREVATIESVKGNYQVYAENKALKETSARRGAKE